AGPDLDARDRGTLPRHDPGRTGRRGRGRTRGPRVDRRTRPAADAVRTRAHAFAPWTTTAQEAAKARRRSDFGRGAADVPGAGHTTMGPTRDVRTRADQRQPDPRL